MISAMIRAFNTTLPAGSPGSWFESHSLMEVVARRPEVQESRLFLGSDTSFDQTILDALRSVTQNRNALGLSRRTNSPDGFRYHIYLKNSHDQDGNASLEKIKRLAKKIADMTSAPREVYQWISLYLIPRHLDLVLAHLPRRVNSTSWMVIMSIRFLSLLEA